MLISKRDTTLDADLTTVDPGDRVEARELHSSTSITGDVELVVPQQGILWIRHGALRERKLLDVGTYQVRSLSRTTA